MASIEPQNSGQAGFGLANRTLGQSVRTFWVMVKKNLIEESRYPIGFITGFLTIFLLIAMFIFSSAAFVPPSNNTTAVEQMGKTAVPAVMTYGFIMFIFIMIFVGGMANEIRWEQTRGTLESIYLTPANKFHYLLAKTFAQFVVSGIMSMVGVAFIYYGIGKVPAENFALGLYIFAMSMLGFLGLGFAFAAFTIIGKQTANMLINFSQFFFMIFCAMFFPFKVLPQPVVDYFCRYIPISYNVDAFRSVLGGMPAGFPELLPLNQELIIVTVFGIVMPFVGYASFRIIEYSARKKGALGEF